MLWHQCLLTLVQRYKADLATEQKEALRAFGAAMGEGVEEEESGFKGIFDKRKKKK